MKRLLIVSFSRLSSDPRILRQISALEDIYGIDAVGYGPKIRGVENFFDLSQITILKSGWRRKLIKAFLLALRLYRRLYFYDFTSSTKAFEITLSDYDLIIANDFSSLPLIKYSINDQTQVFLDAHEYYFDEIYAPFRNVFFKPYRTWISKIHLDRVQHISTVSREIARRYETELGFQGVSVVRNIPELSRFDFIGRANDEVHLIHHGAAVRARGLDELIELVPLLDQRFVLNFMLVDTDQDYFSKLRLKANKLGNRVRFHPIVKTELIVPTISKFDLGIFVHPPLTINSRFTLPNKFFEFIQAHLGIVIGPSPEMAQIVKEYSLGIVAKAFDPLTIAQLLNGLGRPQIEAFRVNSREASKVLCWEEESKSLVAQVANVLESRT